MLLSRYSHCSRLIPATALEKVQFYRLLSNLEKIKKILSFPFESEKICQNNLVHCRIKYRHEYGNDSVV